MWGLKIFPFLFAAIFASGCNVLGEGAKLDENFLGFEESNQASNLSWMEGSLVNSLALTASWSLSPLPNISSQRIVYYLDGICNIPEGLEVTLSSTDISHSFPNATDGNTYSFKVITTDDQAVEYESACSNSASIDMTAPSVLQVYSDAADGTYTIGEKINILVEFSEDVNVTGTPQITMDTGAVVNYTGKSAGNILKFEYTVAATENSAALDYAGTGSLALNTGSINDLAGNPAVLTLALPTAANSISDDQTIVVDTNIPSIISVSSASVDGSYGVGSVISIDIVFSENVIVTGTPQLTLNSTAVVDYTSGTGTSTLTFQYTVQAGEDSALLDYVDANSLALNSGTLKNGGGADFLLTLPTPGAVSSISDNQSIAIDTTPAYVAQVYSDKPDGYYIAGEVINIYVEFNEDVNVTGTPQIALDSAASVDFAANSTTNILKFIYTVGVGESSLDLEYVATNSLTLNGGTINDLAGNASDLTLAAPNSLNSISDNQAIVIDTQAPVITNIQSTTPGDGNYNEADVIDIIVTFDSAISSTTSTLTLDNAAIASLVSAVSNSTTATYRYTVGAGDTSADLNVAGFTVNDAVDIAGNAVDPTLPAGGAGAGNLSTNNNIEIDTTPSTITNITSVTPGDGIYTIGEVIDIVVTFDTPVTTSTSTIDLDTVAGVALKAPVVSSTTATYEYTVLATEDSLDLDVITFNVNDAMDDAGNPLDATLPSGGVGNDNLAVNNDIIIDTTMPTVTSVTSIETDGTYTIGAALEIKVVFSEDITVSGTPTLTLETGASDQVATFTRVDNSNEAVFTYTVVAGDESPDLDYVGTGSLLLAGGTIKDAAMNGADLNLALPGTTGSLSDSKNIVISTTATTITNIESTTPGDGYYKAGDYIEIIVTFSSPIDTSTSTLTLDNSAVVSLVAGVTASTTATYGYTVTAGEDTSMLDVTLFNVGDSVDSLSNAVDATLPTGGLGNDNLGVNNAIVIDTTAPTVPAMDRITGSIHKDAAVVTFSGSTDLYLDNYYYTLDGSTPTCGSTAGASATVNPNVHGTATVVNVIACDFALNESPVETITLHNIIPTIGGYYDNAPAWGDWIVDENDKASAICPGSGTCHHGGAVRGVSIDGITACSDLTLVDDQAIFDWVCDDTSGTAVFKGKFQQGKKINNLIADPTSWVPLILTLSGSTILDTGNNIVSDPLVTYFPNTLTPLPASTSTPTSLSVQGTIYVIDAPMSSAGHSIDASSISILSIGGPQQITKDVSLTGSNCNHANGGTASPDSQCMLIARSVKHLYIDVDIDGSDGTNWVDDIVNFNDVSHSIIERGIYKNALQTGLYMANTQQSAVINVKIKNVHDSPAGITSSTFGDGLHIVSATNDNFFINVSVDTASESGIRINSSSGNRFINLSANHNGDIGLWLENLANNNYFSNVQMSQNFRAPYGMAMQLVNSVDNVFVGLNGVANECGINGDSSNGNLLMNMNLSNNTTEAILFDGTTPSFNSIVSTTATNNYHGLHISFGDNNNVHDFVASNNEYNIQLDANASPNTFSGVLKLGNAGTNDCWTDANTGLNDTDCANTNASTAALTLGVSNASEFMGLAGSPNAYGAIVNWVLPVEFHHWGATGGAFPDPAHIGPSMSGTLEQWDWRLSSGSANLLNANPIPSGNDTFVHTFSDGVTTIEHLLYAREIHPLEGIPITKVGNGNFLCESNESCLLYPNIGAYQGHGNIIQDPGSDITTGTISNVEMWKYDTNGAP